MHNKAKDIIAKTREDYNRIARHFSGTRFDLWPELKPFKKYVQNGQNILDWGCGNGRLLLLLQGQKINYTGVDQSEELLKIAEKKHSDKIKDGWVRFYNVVDEEKKDLSDYYDLVFMIASFHHLPDQESRLLVLKKVAKAMKKGGRLIMTNWNLDSAWAREKVKKGKWTRIEENDYLIPWRNVAGEIECERYYHNFTEKELRSLLVESGFKIEEFSYSADINWTGDKGGRNSIMIAVKK